MTQFNSAYDTVSRIAGERVFTIGNVRHDDLGSYRYFTVYGRDPWQGVLSYGIEGGVPGWYWNGDYWVI